MRLFVLLALAAFAAADTVVLRDGTILEGSVTKGETALAVGGEPAPLAEVLLWEDAALLPRNTPSFEAHARACAALADRQLLAACRQRFPELLAAGAVDEARTALERAALAGLPAKEAADFEKRLLAAEGKEGASGAAPGAEIVAGVLVQRARASLKGPEEHNYRGSELLREALRVDPKHKEALDLLAEIAPERPPFGQGKEANRDLERARRVWLDWHVDVLRGEVRTLGRRNPDMERALTVWDRKDLNGVETREEGSEIVFITPIDDRTEILGKCVRYAKITCRALGRMFATDDPKRDDNEPLRIYFYESKDEYVNYAGQPNPFLTMTAGFYTPSENVSRFFWPDRVDATSAVRDVFVHELTHHWIERRNPRWHARDLAGMEKRVKTNGYWICEGFATFIEEGRYDIDTYTWSHFNSHANSIGVVAALSKEKGKKLIDWEKVYGLTQEEFHGRGLAKQGIFATAWKKWGLNPQPFVEIRLFYEQSAATCHYLYWAEGGKYRRQLLDYVTSFYTSQAGKTGVEGAFGLPPRDLGAKVEEFSKKVVDGWRPGK
jgi:hypothetical protein